MTISTTGNTDEHDTHNEQVSLCILLLLLIQHLLLLTVLLLLLN